MKKVSICLATVGILTCWGCAVTDVDRTADFSGYKSFSWGESHLNVESPAYRSDLVESSIKANIRTEFAKKGIVYDTRKPDLLVSYEAFTKEKEPPVGGSISNYPLNRGFYPFGGYSMSGPFYWTEPPEYYTVTQGALILEVRDKKSGTLIWRGLVSGDVDKVKNLDKRIAKGVRAIVKKYPDASLSSMREQVARLK